MSRSRKNLFLNTKQEEILTILQEECAEVVQAICKIRRFGFNRENVEHLEQEIADVLCMINLSHTHNVLVWDEDKVNQRISKKEERLRVFSTIYETTSDK